MKNDVSLVDKYITLHKKIEKKTTSKHKSDIDLCYEGINIFLLVEDLLQGLEFEHSTPELATRSLLWRYLVSIPSTAYESLQAAIQGQYRIAHILLRILIEETVSIQYYIDDFNRADKAIKRYFKSHITKDAKFSTKLKKWNTESRNSLKALYDGISEGTSHANALLYPGLLMDEKFGKFSKSQI